MSESEFVTLDVQGPLALVRVAREPVNLMGRALFRPLRAALDKVRGARSWHQLNGLLTKIA